MILEKVALWIGYILLLFLAILASAGMIWASYWIYDYYLKKWLGWKEIQTRKDIFYFLKHKKEIQDYIRAKEKQ